VPNHEPPRRYRTARESRDNTARESRDNHLPGCAQLPRKIARGARPQRRGIARANDGNGGPLEDFDRPGHPQNRGRVINRCKKRQIRCFAQQDHLRAAGLPGLDFCLGIVQRERQVVVFAAGSRQRWQGIQRPPGIAETAQKMSIGSRPDIDTAGQPLAVRQWCGLRGHRGNWLGKRHLVSLRCFPTGECRHG
jgi:hypothetical protein